MPQIPLIPGTNLLPNLPAPVLDRERRPTVDNSGVMEAVGRLAKSTAQPMVPDSLAAPYQALGAVGEAVAQAGDVVSAIAVQHQRNQDAIAISKAETSMDVALEKFNLEREKEPDPSKWMALFSTHANKAKEEILGQKMSSRAKEEILRRSQRWNSLAEINVAKASISETARQARDINRAEIELAIQQQNRERFDAAVKSGVANMWMHDTEAQLLDGRYKTVGEQLQYAATAKAYKSAENQVIDIVKRGGADLAIRNIQGGMFGNWDAKQQEALGYLARQVANQEASDLSGRVVEGILKGDIKNVEGIKALTTGNPNMNEVLMGKFTGLLAENERQRIVADREQNGLRNSVEFMRWAKEYDPKEDPTGAKYLTARWAIHERIPENLREPVLQILDHKYRGTPVPLRPEIERLVDRSMEVAFHPVTGAYRYRREEMVKGADRVWRPKEVDFDPKKREEAYTQEALLRGKLSDWATQNPSDAKNPEIVVKKMYEFMRSGDRGEALTQAVKRARAASGVGEINEEIITSVKKMEGFNASAYGDYKQLSVGYGTRARHTEEVLTEAQADARLREELMMHAGRVDQAALVNGIVLTKGQRNALISFDFNTGQGAYLIESSGGNVAEIKRRMQLYNKAGGKESAGLVNRRKMETDIFDL